MKKISNIILVVISPFTAMAQMENATISRSVFDVCATIFLAAISMVFILAALKSVLSYLLKKKIIEKGIPENVATTFLQSNSNEDRNNNLKWFIVLAGIGAGLTIVNYTQPLGIHSLAIMGFSISIGFLIYYIIVTRMKK